MFSETVCGKEECSDLLVGFGATAWLLVTRPADFPTCTFDFQCKCHYSERGKLHLDIIMKMVLTSRVPESVLGTPRGPGTTL